MLELPAEVQQGLIDNNVKSRDKIRLLLKSSNPIDTLTKMIAPVKKSNSAFSVLKIGMKDGNFSVSKGKINALSDINKETLKTILKDVLESI